MLAEPIRRGSPTARAARARTRAGRGLRPAAPIVSTSPPIIISLTVSMRGAGGGWSSCRQAPTGIRTRAEAAEANRLKGLNQPTVMGRSGAGAS